MRRIKNVFTRSAFFHVCIIGGIGLLSDADHLIQWMARNYGLQLPDKFLHAPLVFISGGVLVVITASFSRLFLRTIAETNSSISMDTVHNE